MSDPFAVETQDLPRTLTVSDAAAKRIAFLKEQEGDKALMLRITVSGGGCSGFQYGFSFDDTVTPMILSSKKNGVQVVTDQVSMDLLVGSEVDFVDDLMGSYFQITNPNATASCGCGTSFSV